MEQAMCRICLAQNIRMHSIVNSDLQYVYERLTNHLLVLEARPLLACYICHARLKNCHQLMVKCLQSETILTSMLNGMVVDHRLTASPLSNFNRLYPSPVQFASNVDEWAVVVKEEMPEAPEFEELQESLDAEPSSHVSDSANNVQPQSDSKDQVQGAGSSGIYHVTVKQEVPVLNHCDEEPVKVKVEKDSGMVTLCIEPLTGEDAVRMKVQSDPDVSMKGTVPVTIQQPVRIDSKDAPPKGKNTINKQTTVKKKVKAGAQHGGTNAKSPSKPNSDIVPTTCKICQKIFKRKSSLHYHSILHTGEKPFKCELCTASFNRKDRLNAHNRIHTGVKPYKCDTCQIGFTDKSNFNSHIRKHSVVKPHACEVCQAGFIKLSSLKNHMHVHTGVKNYICDVCKGHFTSRYGLVRHIRSHTGDKPYKCQVCERRFRDQSNYSQHMRLHTGEKRYKCEICQISFTHRTSLIFHNRKHT